MLPRVRVSLGQPQRTGNTALQAIGAACLLLGLVLAPLATTVRADHAQQGEASFDASPTLPLFLGFTLQGRQTRLRITMRNTGKAAWEPTQGIALARLGAEAEEYPLEHRIEPSKAANWDLVVTPSTAGLVGLRYAMSAQSRPFGLPAQALVVALPTVPPRWNASELASQPPVRDLLAWGERAFGGPVRSLRSLAQRRFERFLNGPSRLPRP